MSVLSRRLERFAVIFSIATFAFFLGGFYAAAKTEGQLVFLCAGLASLCLFLAFFLWVAHGFAWAMIPEEPVAARRPAEALKAAEEKRPIREEVKPAEEKRPLQEEVKPAEAVKPAQAMKPIEPIKPAEPIKPPERIKPVEPPRPAEAMKAVEEKKPVQEEVIATEEDPPDAKYTITGKRIY